MNNPFRLQTIGSPCLHARCQEVPLSIKGHEIDLYEACMRDIMIRHEGIGLAANQMGLNYRIAVFTLANLPKIMINPEIHRSGPSELSNEGCLSVPGKLCNIYRSSWVEVSWLDKNMKKGYGIFYGLDAKCVQHEVDHLNGITINQKEKRE